MKLIKAHITNYRSIEDSNEFDIDDLSYLVGKNEAGKSSLLLALRGVNSLEQFSYDKINDYPRAGLKESRSVLLLWVGSLVSAPCA